MRGWIVVGTLTLLTVATAGVATWAFLLQFGLPVSSVLTGTGEIRLPLPHTLAMWLIFGGAIATFLLALGVEIATTAVPSIVDSFDYFDGTVVWLGVTIGAVLAVYWFPPGISMYVVIGVAVCAGLRTLAVIRRAIVGVREEAPDRPCDHVTAKVTAVRFRETWLLGRPEFTVEATYPITTGLRTVSGYLTTAPANAPIVGGTVVAHIGADDPADVVLARDPDSVKDPEAAYLFSAPEA